MRRSLTIAPLVLVLAPALALAQEVRIGVLGLFHPREFTVRPAHDSALVVHAGQESLVLEAGSLSPAAHIAVLGSRVSVRTDDRTLEAPNVIIKARESDKADFLLSVPGKITRHYQGVLEFNSANGTLVAVVRMDLETAVASVVAAENPADVPLEAQKAQAVAARSYLVIPRRAHRSFDFCDTTHCQFLRDPPSPASAAARAATATRGLILAHDARPIAAMYTRSCSGQTRTPAELGITSDAYSYYTVDCPYCREHPSLWQSRISVEDAVTLRSSSERTRLELDRRLGWDAIPSNTFTIQPDGRQVVLHGVGRGHGIGLCQAGARAMAEQGADFLQILRHYYPNTAVMSAHRLASQLSRQ